MQEESNDTLETRIPRPSGLTLKLRRIHHLPTKHKNKQLKLLYIYMIKDYIHKGLQVNNVVLDTNQFRVYLGIPEKRFNQLLKDATTELASVLGNTDQINDSYRALISSCIKSSLADRHRAIAQFDTLYLSQVSQKTGVAGFVPFLSGTVNQAMKNLFDSNRMMLDVARTIVPNPDTVINIQQNQTTETYLTTDSALSLIHHQQKALDPTVHRLNPPSDIQQMYETHNIGKMVEVKANGLIKTDGAGARGIEDEELHQDRRINDEGIEDIEIEMGTEP